MRAMEPTEYELMDTVEERLWWYQALHARLVDALSQVRGRVLDAGCGTGGFLKRLARERPDLLLVGCDSDILAATRARRKATSAIAVGSVNALPFPTGAFDAVVSADVLCHQEVRPEAAIAEMRRVLRPGGMLVVNMPAFMWLHSTHDRHVHNARRVTVSQLSNWLRSAGFSLLRVRYWNSLLLPLMIVQRKLLSKRPGAASDVAPVHPLLNAAFRMVTHWERDLSLPAGGSVMAMAVRS